MLTNRTARGRAPATDAEIPLTWVNARLEGPWTAPAHLLLTWVIANASDENVRVRVAGKAWFRGPHEFGPISNLGLGEKPAAWTIRTVDALAARQAELFAHVPVSSIYRGGQFAAGQETERLRPIVGVERDGALFRIVLDPHFEAAVQTGPAQTGPYTRVALHGGFGSLTSLPAARLRLWAGARLGLSSYNGTDGNRPWRVSLPEISGILGMAGQRPDAVAATLKRAIKGCRFDDETSLSLLCRQRKEGRKIVGFEFKWGDLHREAVREAFRIVSPARSTREGMLNLWEMDHRPRLRASDLRLLITPERVDALKADPDIVAVGGLAFLNRILPDFSVGNDLRQGDDVEALFSTYARKRAMIAADPALSDLPGAILVDWL